MVHLCTEHSLVILDELGRGTSTLDGTAIAYAVTKHILEVARCRCLFATHYHLLTEEFRNSPKVNLSHMACMVDEEEGGSESVVFLYKLEEGALCNSFGLNVGKLSGMSKDVLARAGQVSKEFEDKLTQGRSTYHAKSLCGMENAQDVEGLRALWTKLEHRR